VFDEVIVVRPNESIHDEHDNPVTAYEHQPAALAN
jgi:hypothetical protein